MKKLVKPDDILVIRATSSRLDQVRLQEDLQLIQGFLASVGLELNGGKCKLLNLSLAGARSLECGPAVGGRAIEEVRELRWLGCLLDERLSFAPHWAATSASGKAAIGAISRLVHRDPVALRFLFQERVVSALLHTLPFTPPGTVDGWRRLAGLFSFTAHLLTNNWRSHGLEVIEEAGLPSPGQLCFVQGLKFVFNCWAGRRKFGEWVEREVRTGKVTQLRSEVKRCGHEVVVPGSGPATWDHLAPIRLLHAWNSLPFASAGIDPKACLKSRGAFASALPLLASHLTPEQAAAFGAPTAFASRF